MEWIKTKVDKEYNSRVAKLKAKIKDVNPRVDFNSPEMVNIFNQADVLSPSKIESDLLVTDSPDKSPSPRKDHQSIPNDEKQKDGDKKDQQTLANQKS